MRGNDNNLWHLGNALIYEMGTMHLSSKRSVFSCADNLERLCGFPINALFGLDNGSIFDLLLQRTNLCKEADAEQTHVAVTPGRV